MGMMDELLNRMKLNGPADEYDEDIDEDDYEEEPQQRTPILSINKKSAPVEDDDYDEPRKSPVNSKVTSIRQQPSRGTKSGSGICVIKPTSVDEAKEVTERLLENRAVVLNLEGLDVEIAQRIIDFSSGTCYAIRGKLTKISNFIFVITPASVNVSGDFQDLIGAMDVPGMR